MYSFHPFGGLSSHPYGGSTGGLVDNLVSQGKSAAAGAAKSGIDQALGTGGKKKKRPGAVPPPPKRGTGNSKKALSVLSSFNQQLADMKASVGASQRVENALTTNTAAIANAKNLLSKVNTPNTLRMTPALVEAARMMEEQGLMGAGGEAEEGFFSKYRNFVLIGGAVAVVGVAAFFMLRK